MSGYTRNVRTVNDIVKEFDGSIQWEDPTKHAKHFWFRVCFPGGATLRSCISRGIHKRDTNAIAKMTRDLFRRTIRDYENNHAQRTPLSAAQKEATQIS